MEKSPRRMTDRALKILALATKYASQLGSASVAPEHVLCGLVEENQGVAANVLRSIGISSERLGQILGIPPRMGEMAADVNTGTLSPSTDQLLDEAANQCKELGHMYIGTEHLLLAIARRPEGEAANLLRSLGADLAAVRHEVLSILGHTE